MPLLHRLGVLITVVACCAATTPYALGQPPAQPQKVEIPATATTLEGVPTVRVDATEGTAKRRVLGPSEASKERLKVSIVNGQYFWTSRDNRLLRLDSSGEFTYLSSEPGKYIRLTRLNDKIEYVEHLDQGPRSVTWWGELRIVLQK